MNGQFVQASHFRRVLFISDSARNHRNQSMASKSACKGTRDGDWFVKIRSLLNAPWVIALIALAFVLGFLFVLQGARNLGSGAR
jgi:hypothetical protein